jgi:hypothetical protein
MYDLYIPVKIIRLYFDEILFLEFKRHRNFDQFLSHFGEMGIFRTIDGPLIQRPVTYVITIFRDHSDVPDLNITGPF